MRVLLILLLISQQITAQWKKLDVISVNYYDGNSYIKINKESYPVKNYNGKLRFQFSFPNEKKKKIKPTVVFSDSGIVENTEIQFYRFYLIQKRKKIGIITLYDDNTYMLSLFKEKIIISYLIRKK